MKIAYLVFNDTWRDSRVLKMVDSAAERGNQARLFALGGPTFRYEAGIELRPSGAEIERLGSNIDGRLGIYEHLIHRPLLAYRKRRGAISNPTPVLRRAVRLFGRFATWVNRYPRVKHFAQGLGYPAYLMARNIRQLLRNSNIQVADVGQNETVAKISTLMRRIVGWGISRIIRWERAVFGAAFTKVSVEARTRAIARRDASLRQNLSDAIEKWQPDLLHAHDGNTLDIAIDVQKRTGIPFVYDAHELWEDRNKVRSDEEKAKEKQLLDKATKLMAGSITVSPGIQNWMQRRYSFEVAPTLVRNIPITAGEPITPDKGRLRELAGLSTTEKVLVYVGRITTGRGIPETIRALQFADKDIHLVLLGYGTDKYVDELTKIAIEAEVSNRIHFVGSVEGGEVPETLADADASVVFVEPINLSYRFSLPNKLFESIHGGQAIIASDLPDISEIVSNHGVGEVVSPEDAEKFGTVISQVIRDKGRYQDASKMAISHFQWDNEMEKLFGLYDDIMDTRRLKPQR